MRMQSLAFVAARSAEVDQRARSLEAAGQQFRDAEAALHDTSTPEHTIVFSFLIRTWYGRLATKSEKDIEEMIADASRELVFRFGGDHLDIGNAIRRLVTREGRPSTTIMTEAARELWGT